MSDLTEDRARQALDELADRASPDQIKKLDRQFLDKLTRLEQDDTVSPEVVDRLRLFWRTLHAPDERVPWRSKALLMAAIMYFASPLDMIPDFAGKLGYLDDAMVLKIVHRRLADEIEAFRGQPSPADD